MRPIPLVILLALGTVWGASFLFIKIIVEETGPMEMVVGRLFFGTVAVLLFMAVRRVPVRRDPAFIAKVSVLALFSNVIPFALIGWAEEQIDSGIAAALNSTMPLFTALFAAAFLAEERFSVSSLLGLLGGFFGVVILAGGDIVDVTDSNVLGQLAVVGAGACYGAGAVYARTLLRTEDPLSLSGLQLLPGTLLAIPLLFAVEGGANYSLSVKAWLSLVTLGILGSGVAYVTYLWLVDHIGSVRASLVTYVIPVVGLLLGWAVLDEPLSANTFLGTGLIIAGVAGVMRGTAPTPQRASTAAAAVGCE